MKPDDRPPRVDPARAMPLRLGAILLAYVIYRSFYPAGPVTALFVGFGTLLIGYMVVTRLVTRPSERSDLLQTGQAILGIGLIAVGLLRAGGII